MKHSQDRAEFELAIREWVEMIDQKLRDDEVPIPDRPAIAAELFLEHAVVEVVGSVKKEYLTSEWYRHVVAPVNAWYREKYGASLKRKDQCLLGVISVLGDYFLVRVPTSYCIAGDGDTYTVVFPTDIQPEEDPASWIESPPSLSNMAAPERDAIVETVTAICVPLRNVHMGITNTELQDANARSLSGAVVIHLNAAARHVANGGDGHWGLSHWEAHQAVEKALKLFALQMRGGYPRTHSITSLLGLIEEYAPDVARMDLGTIADERLVIALRTGESENVDASAAYGVYRTALSFLDSLVAVLPRKLVLKNTRFHMRKLPWQKRPGTTEP